MGFRYRKSFKIGKGVKLNVGKKSVGISAGGKRGGVSFNSRSGARARVSAPGTGLSYSTKIGGKKSSAKKSNTSKKRSSSRPDTSVDNTPIPRRWWYVVLEIIFIYSGLSNLFKKPSGAIPALLIGFAMVCITIGSKNPTDKD